MVIAILISQYGFETIIYVTSISSKQYDFYWCCWGQKLFLSHKVVQQRNWHHMFFRTVTKYCSVMERKEGILQNNERISN